GRPDSPRSFRRRRDRRSTCRGSRRSRSATRNEDRPSSNGGSAPSDRRTDTEVVSPVVLDPKEVQVRTHMTRLRAALVLLLVGSGLLFAIGSTIERYQHHAEHTAAASGENEQSGESGGENNSSETTTPVER